MSEKLAQIIGIDYYKTLGSLHGCVHDAHAVKAVLERNGDGSINFECQLMTASGPDSAKSKRDLKDAIVHLFSKDVEVALLYFAGHGHEESTGGFLVDSEAERGDDGLSLNEVMTIATKSPAKNKVIILDSCFSGVAGDSPLMDDTSVLIVGTTILTASGKKEYASEEDGSGVFTSLLVDALSGGAADLLGNITPGAVYAYIDQALGDFGQRPLFKTNVKKFISLRQVPPPISQPDLRLISQYFPKPGYEFPLDPTFEPEMKGRSEGMPDPIPANTGIFSKLQKYNRLNLLKPVGAEHMWNAAMESKSCKLTALGEHYRRLVAIGRI
jgi:uncharacterized caspase-like protein